jgi:tetratricopeptide (TPR) repeat protein
LAEDLKRALVLAAERLQKKDTAGALEALAPLVQIDVEPATRVEALRIVSLAKLLAGDAAGALEASDEAVNVSEHTNPGVRGRAFERRAFVRQAKNDLEGARADLGRAARAFAEAGETQIRAQVEDRRGALAASRGELERATALHLTSAALRRGEKPPSLADGDRAPALLKLLESLPAKDAKSADPLGEAQALVHSAGAAHLAGGRPIARSALERALVLLADAPATSTRALRAEALHNLGVVLSDLGDHKAGLEKLEAALNLDQAGGSARDIVATRLRLSLVARRAGDMGRSRQEAESARADASKSGDTALAIEATLEASSACLAAGDGEAALAAAKAALDASAEIPPLHARATLHAASCAKALGKKDSAREGFSRAKALAEKVGDKILAAAAERELATL